MNYLPNREGFEWFLDDVVPLLKQRLPVFRLLVVGKHPPAHLMARAKPKRFIRCYLCGFAQEVSSRTMSTTCPECHKAIKVEDVVIKTYLPVNDLQTCGKIKITKRGRVAARRIQSGEGFTVTPRITLAVNRGHKSGT